MEEMIKLLNVSLKIKNDVILNHINATFERGKIYGLIGRNGSGKTMLMKCICGFVKATEGSILIDGKRVGKDIDFYENMGIIIETPGFIPYYSGYKNLKVLADLNHKADKKRIRETMECVGLFADSKKIVKKYSLGMRQRLGIAQAIMEEPDLLILDEPFNGLDVEGVEQMCQLFQQLKEKNVTMIMASHNAQDIALLCDTVFEMKKGMLL